jgi:monomeric isocitrate dehydrogenase
MANQKSKIIYTLTDEAPLLATTGLFACHLHFFVTCWH